MRKLDKNDTTTVISLRIPKKMLCDLDRKVGKRKRSALVLAGLQRELGNCGNSQAGQVAQP